MNAQNLKQKALTRAEVQRETHLLLESVPHGVLIKQVRGHIALRSGGIAGRSSGTHDDENFEFILSLICLCSVVCGLWSNRVGAGNNRQG